MSRNTAGFVVKVFLFLIIPSLKRICHSRNVQIIPCKIFPRIKYLGMAVIGSVRIIGCPVCIQLCNGHHGIIYHKGAKSGEIPVCHPQFIAFSDKGNGPAHIFQTGSVVFIPYLCVGGKLFPALCCPIAFISQPFDFRFVSGGENRHGFAGAARAFPCQILEKSKGAACNLFPGSI